MNNFFLTETPLGEAGTHTISDDDVPNDATFCRQYKVYADARGGSRDLCKVSLDLRMPAPIYPGMVCRTLVNITLRF